MCPRSFPSEAEVVVSVHSMGSKRVASRLVQDYASREHP